MRQFNVDQDALGDDGIDPNELEDEAELELDDFNDPDDMCDGCAGECGQCDFYRKPWGE